MKKIRTENIKRAWLISDIHFGVRSSSLEWLDIHEDYFYNFFIPLLEKNKKPGDAIFVLGDIFESRQSVNILVLNKALEVFRDISKIMHKIGKHDLIYKIKLWLPIIFMYMFYSRLINPVVLCTAI